MGKHNIYSIHSYGSDDGNVYEPFTLWDARGMNALEQQVLNFI